MNRDSEISQLMKVPAMPDHTCNVHESAFRRIDAKLDLILERMSNGDTKFATMDLRLSAVEKRASWLVGVVIGVGGLFSMAIIGALLKLVIVGK